MSQPTLASAAALTGLLLLAPELRTQADDPEPETERGLRVNTEAAVPGHTLFAPIMSRTAYLVDMEGVVVHSWELPYPPSAVYLRENGHLLFCGRLDDNPRFNGGGICGAVVELDWEGDVVWEYVLADDYQTQHHDIELMPNGNVLMIVWEHRFQEDVLEWGRDPSVTGEAGLWPDAVLEIEPTRPEGGEIVWEWHVWDHTVQDFDPARSNYGSVPEHPELVDINADHRDRPAMSEAEKERLAALEEQMRALGYSGEDEEEESAPGGPGGQDMRPDWLHTNGIAYQPEYDLIALSIPELNEVWVIDHSTSIDDAAGRSGGRWGKGGGLLYRWGNPRNYGLGTDADRRLYYQHDPTWVSGEDGDLRLLVYNNGGGRPDGDYSTVLELDLPFDPERGFLREEGQAFGPAEPAWKYEDREGFFSGFISGAQRLPGGNTLICSGADGRVFEVTRAGEIVWEYLNPFEGKADQGQGGSAPPVALFRATRIPAGHPGLAAHLGPRTDNSADSG